MIKRGRMLLLTCNCIWHRIALYRHQLKLHTIPSPLSDHDLFVHPSNYLSVHEYLTGENEHMLETSCRQQLQPRESNIRGNGVFGYKLVGDNIDISVNARYMRAQGYSNQSLHFFHSYAGLI